MEPYTKGIGLFLIPEWKALIGVLLFYLIFFFPSLKEPGLISDYNTSLWALSDSPAQLCCNGIFILTIYLNYETQ